MQSTATPTAPASRLPIMLPRTTPADLIGEVLAKLRATRDPAKQAALLELGIDVLRRRQADRKGARR